MAEEKTMRLNKVLREFNISLDRAVEYLNSKGHEIEARPTAKISEEVYHVLLNEFSTDKSKKVASKEVGEEKRKEKEELRVAREKELEEKRKAEHKQQEIISARIKLEGPKQVGKIDLDKKPEEKPKEVEEEKPVQPVAEIAPQIVEETKVIEPIAEIPEKEEPKVVEPKEKEHKAEEPKVVSPKAEAPKLAAAKTEKPVEAEITSKETVVKEEKTTEKPVSPVEPQVEEVPENVEEETVEKEPGEETLKTNYTKLNGPQFTGEKIDLTKFKKPVKKKDDKKAAAESAKGKNKKRRRRISKDVKPAPSTTPSTPYKGAKGVKRPVRPAIAKEEPSEEAVQKQVRETLEKLQGKSGKGKGAKYRRDKRDHHRQKTEDELAQQESESKVLKVTEFVTVSEIATMMDVPVTKIISTCMSLGMMVTMNQRLDAETLSIVADEFDYEIEFVSADIEETIETEEDRPEDLESRAPIVTVMGHVDHGKTSLLDYIRKENVIAGESGGITQHIGAYGVELEDGQKISFLDTPGHEAFTAMRARGAQVTDIAVLVVAADDGVMPQTIEAINHAKAAEVPIIVAINKIDKENATPEKVKQELTEYGLVVEEWGGETIAVPVSAKGNIGIDKLLENILLIAEVQDYKDNPKRAAAGTVIEAELDKGKGPIATVLVSKGTLNIGDVAVAGCAFGRIKAMLDDNGHRVKKVGPSMPVEVQGLSEVPEAGELFYVVADEKLARQITSARIAARRVEDTKKTVFKVSLEDLFERIKEGEIKELNIIIKADVQGSVEALRQSLLRLSTSEVRVNPIHGGVGAINKNDIMLASASNAIIIGFNVRPDSHTKATAELEGVDLRLYRVIYDAIEDVKAAMTGLLDPTFKEVVLGKVEVRMVFKVPKAGTVAGCMVTEGKIVRSAQVRVIRDSIVIHEGVMESLRRFKDDVKEVAMGYECGVGIGKFNDLKEGDIIEAFMMEEVKRTL